MNTIPSHDRIWLIDMGDEIVWCDDSNPAGASEAPDTREFVSLEKHAALAAHVERFECAASGGWSDIYEVMADTPEASLAKLKAQWQAEALEHAAKCVAPGCRRELMLWANEKRRQAEEP